MLVLNSTVREMTISYLGLGSNLGDREAYIRSAVTLLNTEPEFEVLRCSDIYETEPIGPAGQANYLNAVLAAKVTCSARLLLDLCLQVEQRLGRTRSVRWGPRVIDIDLLFFGDTVLTEPDLVLPHPYWGQRSFVLVPLAEVVPVGTALAADVAAALEKADCSGVRLWGAWRQA